MKNKKKTNKYRVFGSMKQASGALKISWETLKDLKDDGCPAFKSGGRVNEKELMEHITTRLEGMAQEEEGCGAWIKKADVKELWEDAQIHLFHIAFFAIETKAPNKDQVLAALDKAWLAMRELSLILGARTQADWDRVDAEEVTDA